MGVLVPYSVHAKTTTTTTKISAQNLIECFSVKGQFTAMVNQAIQNENRLQESEEM